MIKRTLSVQNCELEGIYHSPYGIDDLYEIEPTERYPRDPIEGDNVLLNVTTWPITSNQNVFISWTKNGVIQKNINGLWKYNNSNNSYWEIDIGSFCQGDYIEYTLHATQNGSNDKLSGPFNFKVTNWEQIASISSYEDYNSHIVLNGISNKGINNPKINISFENNDVVRVQMSPFGNNLSSTGIKNYQINDEGDFLSIKSENLILKINKNPYKMSIYKSDDTLISNEYDIDKSNYNFSWLTDGSNNIRKLEDSFYTSNDEQFYGFGMHYNNFCKRGFDVDTYVYNQYRNQNSKTYMAIPFFVSTRGYGICVNSTYYTKFQMASKVADKYSFTVDSGDKSDAILDYYIITSEDIKGVLGYYSEITGKSNLLPKWAYGLWMSANEWRTQDDVTNAINNANKNNIPATVLVLEQWSDENTFYIFNGSTYKALEGDQKHQYKDFTFSDLWPDPKQMTKTIHDNGLKLILWQVPILKYTESEYEQKDNDEKYMIEKGYQVGDRNNGSYRIPQNEWFGNSLLLDFTNNDAISWWMSKRDYLFDEVGVDGIKTDGGEMVWGRDTLFHNGKFGDEMRNLYPNLYINSYYKYCNEKRGQSLTFARSGTTGAQMSGAFWAGDQNSDFNSYHQALLAGLSANISGVPFWGWDLAGFTGEFPSAELYKRSVQMATFCPIMQFHSEKANPSPSEERSPWNVQKRTGDDTIIDTFTEYVNIRMNLIPYIYSEAKKSSKSGIPLMRPMIVDFFKDKNVIGITDQYMFGDNLLIAPIVNQGEIYKNIYLPDGEWADFWWGALRPGGRNILYHADENNIPVFIKEGGIIPLNLNSKYELGGTISNNLLNYDNLTFNIFPSQTSSYIWFDDVANCDKKIEVIENYNENKITINLPSINQTFTLRILTTEPSSIAFNNKIISKVDTIENLINESEGYYFDNYGKLLYVKLDSSSNDNIIEIKGVYKSCYEAEFASLNIVSTNTNHFGYEGPGFVDNFDSVGSSVEFEIYVRNAGDHKIILKYSAGNGDAYRTIILNDKKSESIKFNKTNSWDDWKSVEYEADLNYGLNKIKINYNITDEGEINLDNLMIK